MPSESKAQHNFMEGVAHGMKPNRRGHGGKAPSVKVAKEFVAADKGRNLSKLPAKKSAGLKRGMPKK